MTTEAPEVNQPDTAPPEDPVGALRDEMAIQFADLKKSFEAQLQESAGVIEKLTAENKELHRAVVRSAVAGPTPTPAKSESEIYQDKINMLAGKTLQYMVR